MNMLMKILYVISIIGLSFCLPIMIYGFIIGYLPLVLLGSWGGFIFSDFCYKGHDYIWSHKYDT